MWRIIVVLLALQMGTALGNCPAVKTENEGTTETCPNKGSVCALEYTDDNKCRTDIKYLCKCKKDGETFACPVNNDEHKLYWKSKTYQYFCGKACTIGWCPESTVNKTVYEIVTRAGNLPKAHELSCRCSGSNITDHSAGNALRFLQNLNHPRSSATYTCAANDQTDPCKPSTETSRSVP